MTNNLIFGEFRIVRKFLDKTAAQIKPLLKTINGINFGKLKTSFAFIRKKRGITQIKRDIKCVGLLILVEFRDTTRGYQLTYKCRRPA